LSGVSSCMQMDRDLSTDIIVEKIDETWMKIHCDDSIAKELWETFTFEVESSRTRGIKQWDGKIRLFHMRTRKMYLGLLRKLCEWAYHEGFSIEIPDISYGNEWSVKENVEFIKKLDLPEKLDTEREYQHEGVTHAIRNKRTVLEAATSSGKSYMIYLIMSWIMSHGKKKKGVIIVPSIGLVKQLFSDFEEYGFDSEKFCHVVYSETGEGVDTNKPITISTWQSLQDLDPEFFHQFQFVFGDEAHGFKAKKLKYIMENMINADYRIGTTGTLQDMEVHRLTITGLFGPPKSVIKTHELIKQGYATPVRVKMLLLNHPKHICKIRKKDKWAYQTEISYLAQCDYRNKFITNLSLSLEGNTIVFFNLVDKHGKLIYDGIVNRCDDDTIVHFISGKVKAKEREEIRQMVNTITDKKHILVASYGTTSTGVNMPLLHNAILAHGFKSKIRNLQSIGRILRQAPGKEHATVFDMGDNLLSGGELRRNFTYEHFVERMKLYAGERFPYETDRINIGI
jgi:superfamily II DNA or RNA helicase